METATNGNATQVKKTFFDEDGELSFYVKNASQGDVMISDLGINIPLLGVMDLRERFDVEVLKKSPGLREAMSPRANWLKRIQREEYEKLLVLQAKREGRILEQKRKVKQVDEAKALATNEGKIKEVKVNLRPKIESMVQKYRLFVKGEDQTVGQEDMLTFVQTIDLTNDEKSYILGVITDPQIREAVNKQTTEEVASR